MQDSNRITSAHSALITFVEYLRKRRMYITVLSCFVVFITTYLLILPAVTLDQDEAEKQGGIDVQTQKEQLEDTPVKDPDTNAKASYSDKIVLKTEPDVESGDITYTGKGFEVSANCDNAGLPEGTELVAEEINKSDKSYDGLYEDALKAVQKDSDNKVSDFAFAKFYDISLLSDGEAIEPENPLNVKISFDKGPEASDAGNIRIVHFAVDEKTGKAKAEVLDPDTVDAKIKSGKMKETTFAAESFSVYAIVYTVDFHWEVDGKKYDYSFPGGGYVGLEELMELLGVVENSEEAEQFVSKVENVEFSDPDLVWVGKAEEETTVGGLKEANELECQYSAELTDEQIKEIDEQTVAAGDWALISQQPFESKESLTVSMENGDEFVVNVTDHQISTNVLSADGKNYKITVTYDEDAKIPAGTELVAQEIKAGTKDYAQHLGEAWAEVNKEYLEQEEIKKNNKGGLDDYDFEDIRPVNLNDARFFNISLVSDKKEIEPKTPVHVDIEYVEGFDTDAEEEDQVIGVAHYKEKETELITDVETERNKDGEIVEFIYEQDSFSDIGTYVGQKTYDNVPYKMGRSLADPLLQSLSKAAGNTPELKDIEAHKSLTNNNDGTYTMSLTVKGDAVQYAEYNKANILFVMDRSSSMTNNKVYQEYKKDEYPGGTTYYRKNGDNYEALNLWNGQLYVNGSFTPYTGTVYTSVTRLVAEQAAMDVLIQDLLAMNDPDTQGKEDIIEISVISFADQRQSGNTEYTNWTSSDYTGLMNAVNQTNTPSGTNWEDALIYAKQQADFKKAAQPDEDVYVIFLTDGEPTAVYGETGNAHHYISSTYPYPTIGGGFEFALTEDPTLYSGSAGIVDNKNALDRAKEIVDANYKLYGIFTFNPGVEQTKYLRRLMNFAYTGVDKAYENDQTQEDTEIVKKYFTNADTPETLAEAFDKVFADIDSTLGHVDVVLTDGLQAADAMTTTIHANKADGYRYSVTDGNGDELFYVTATGNDTNPTVTFHIGDQEYPAGTPKTGEHGKPYYSVTVDGTEYEMALADLSGRELKWDLSALGTLLPGCTYKMDIIVWPNQAAYDYVAGLNNKLPGYTWDSTVESNPDNYHEITVNEVTYGYYTGGVANHESIVKYKDSDVYSVLTNTHQELNYSIVSEKTNEVTGETEIVTEPQPKIELEPQKPMDLIDTNSSVEKQWNVDLDPSILAQLLYPADGSHYTLNLDVYQDTNTTPYRSLELGWDDTQKKYVWESGSEIEIPYDGKTYTIGTTWKTDFAIPTGLMLSEERMEALGMDKSAYPSGTYPVDPEDPNSELKTYYILEDGHDYTIKERNLSYEFDFNADVFHPMLVDGKMQNVNFTKSGMNVSISKMTGAEEGLSSLKVENTLRGYLHLQKFVVDQDGDAIPSDKTKFTYTIELTNDDALFEGTHIPWYGINGLYYHDRDFNYYQVYYENNQLKIKNEAGAVYTVINNYDINNAAEQKLIYRDGEDEVELWISGNQTNPSDENKKATATLEISQGELLSIANIPAGSRYVVTETVEPGYSLVGINNYIRPEDLSEVPEATININNGSITGTIVPNHHNYVDYTNKRIVTDITVQKVDTNGTGLEGAVFQLKKVGSDGHSESDASEIGSVSGLTTITKIVNGQSRTFTSAFESTGSVQTIGGLPTGTYRLYEVVLPAGHISTYGYIQFEIEGNTIKNVTTDTGDTSMVDTTANNIDLKIKNEPGTELPNSGGPGTTWIYLLGSLLLLGSGIMLAARRRTGH